MTGQGSASASRIRSSLLGLALLVVGVILLVYGINQSESVVSDVKEVFTGSPTDKSVWFIVGGAAAGVAGLAMLLLGRRATKA